MSRKRRKLNRNGILALRILFCVFLGIFLFSAYNLYSIMHAYREGARTYEEIAEKARPAVQEDEPEAGIDFTALAAINPDIVGWMELEGTIINYPVVQGTDNAYYLEHLFNREVNHMGSLFIDCRSDALLGDKLTPIYGHHTNSGAMFCTLENYKEQAFYDEHPYFIYTSPQGEYRLEAVAGTLMNAEEDFLQTAFTDEDGFLDYIAYYQRNSTFVSRTEVLPGDRVVMLLTCTADYENARYVLICRVVPVNVVE